MARSFPQNIAHIVFSTKQRDPLISGEMEKDLHAYLGGIIRELKGVPLNINGTEDHVHILARTPKTVADADFMRTIKANSSSWVKSEFPASRSFAWQEGYGWFSVSKSNVAAVSEYIDRQKEHHQSRAFKDEFLRLLEKHEVEYDERFVWD
ncbi:MAG: IS200/IS605 family transposase [Verrucomicrobia bacterium]|nr:IS200/IS605 family transposase [Verrucomicrobiota bacterium]